VPLILQDLKLQSEDGTTRCFASFQGAMCFLHLCQGESLVNVNFDFAALHHSKQIVSHGLRAFARCDVAEQGLACDVQRTFDAKIPGAKGATGPDALPKVAIKPKGRKQSSDFSQVSLPTES